MKTVIKLLFSGLWQAILSAFGKSTDEKLGIAETTVATQAAVLQEVSDAQKIEDHNRKLNAATLRLLTKQWERTD